VLAKLAAPGMCNPADATPYVDGTPAQDATEHDTRSAAQRNYDALTAAGRVLLASGALGQYNGLPATIIVTTTLRQLEAAAGRGLTGGGTLLPMSDVIRLASQAHHYLAIFDKGKAVGLYHTKRLASPGQRIVLYANRCEGYALLGNWRRITVHGFPACLLPRLAGTGAISPPVVLPWCRTGWTQMLIRCIEEADGLVAGQRRFELLHCCTRCLRRSVAAIPDIITSLVTGFQHRRSHSGDACCLQCGNEVRRIGVRNRVGTQSHNRQDGHANYPHPSRATVNPP